MQLQTKAIHVGRGVDPVTGAVSIPLHKHHLRAGRRRFVPVRLRIHARCEPDTKRL